MAQNDTDQPALQQAPGLSSSSIASVVPPADTPGTKGLLAVVIGVVVVGALYLARDVLVPIMLAVLLSFLLTPLVMFLRRLRFGRTPSVILAVTVAIGIIASLGTVIGTQVANLASDVPRYTASIQDKVAGLSDSIVGRLPKMLGQLEGQMSSPAGQSAAGFGAPNGGRSSRPPIPVEVHEPAASPLAAAAAILKPILGPIETTVIVLVIAVFFLLQREDLRDRVIRLFGSNDLHKTTIAMDEAAAKLSRYFVTQLALNSAFGAVVGIGLYFIDVPSAALWGVLAALMRFIPYIGAFLAAVPPLVLAAAVDPGWTMALLVMGLFLVAEPIMGYVVEPMVYGHSTGLSPVSVVVAAIFWTWLWGPIGLILSTPLTLCLVVLGRHVERLEFLDVLLGDRPALTPVESFYQRVLAGDPDEALDQAEQLLKECSLSSYYDEVAIPGLQLATADAGRGVMTPDAVGRINDAVEALMGDLTEQGDAEPESSVNDFMPPPLSEQALEKAPPPGRSQASTAVIPTEWSNDGAILCLYGRGPFDRPASAMLSQLLGMHGLGSRSASVDIASRQHIRTLDPTGVMMVCITYLDISGSPSHLRYLLRRVRQRMPGIPVTVGLWPAEDRTMTDPHVQAIVGADAHVSTLSAAVEACLAAAAGSDIAAVVFEVA